MIEFLEFLIKIWPIVLIFVLVAVFVVANLRFFFGILRQNRVLFKESDKDRLTRVLTIKKDVIITGDGELNFRSNRYIDRKDEICSIKPTKASGLERLLYHIFFPYICYSYTGSHTFLVPITDKEAVKAIKQKFKRVRNPRKLIG